jgi:hypothetical protein
MRTQKPLTINAANMGIMAFATFLRVNEDGDLSTF